MPKKTSPSPAADATAPVPEAAGELHFFPSLGITVRALTLAEAVAFAEKLTSAQ